MKKTFNLGKVAYYGKRKINAVDIEMELRRIEKPARTVDLETVETYQEFSVMGGFWNGRGTDYTACGQVIDEIADFFPQDKTVQEIRQLWQRWHLNGMKAGTRKQNEAIEAYRATKQPGERFDYTDECTHLSSLGILEDGGYKYGSALLVEPMPPEVIARIEQLLAS